MGQPVVRLVFDYFLIYFSIIARAAKKVFAENGVADRITLIKGKIEVQ
jgi:hypothetical protein